MLVNRGCYFPHCKGYKANTYKNPPKTSPEAFPMAIATPNLNIPKPNNEKARWADDDDDDGDADFDFLLMPPQVIGPDENGIKKVIEYKFLEDGSRVKKTTTTRLRKLTTTRLSKRALERRSWPKFEDPGLQNKGNTTVVSTEEVFIQKPRAHEENNAVGDSSAQHGKGSGVLMLCRTCRQKGDHWTARCPYKDLAPQPEGFSDKPASSDGTASSLVTNKGTYIPPMRRGTERSCCWSDMKHRNEENKVHVSNLSEETRESDLHDLFSPFGTLTRAWVSTDHKTGICKGYGSVNFLKKEDAEKAIYKLDGYGYDNLILKVEWSAPKLN